LPDVGESRHEHVQVCSGCPAPWRCRDRHPMRRTIGRVIARLPSRVRSHLYWMNHLPLAARHVPHDRQSPALCAHKNDGAVAWRVCNGIAPW
jgi:hypothetical protein